MNLDLFGEAPPSPQAPFEIVPGAFALPGFALSAAPMLWAGISSTLLASPLRHLHTPSGLRMSVAMSNCGTLGWVSDASGYRYQATDPLTPVSYTHLTLPTICSV